MEMLDGSRRLIREWETSSMEEGLHRQNTLIQLLRQRETRLQRMVQFLAAALLLLFSVTLTLALLITVVLGARAHQSPDNQTMTQPISHSSGVSFKQQQSKDFRNPRAMLTAPTGNNTIGEYLAWESKIGNAFCHGGFNYSSGNLVVPRNGMYRVFLQITYESKEGLGSECLNNQLKLTNKVCLIRDTYKGNMLLLSTLDTVSCSMEPWSKSLYTAGTFFLEANCRLRVTSTHLDLIAKNEHEVFFGAELLPQ